MSAGGVAGGKVDESTVVAASCGSWEDGRKGDNDGVFTFAAGEGGGELETSDFGEHDEMGVLLNVYGETF